MTYFVVMFERSASVNYQEFHKAFVGDPRIGKWWHYIKSSYIVGTTMTVDELADHYTNCATMFGISTTHLCLKVNLRYRQGRLIEDAWKWLRTNADES